MWALFSSNRGNNRLTLLLLQDELIIGYLLCIVAFRLVLFTVAQRMVHSCVNQTGWPHIVSQMFLGRGDSAVGLGLTVVQIVVIGVVSEDTVVHLHIITV